MRENLPGYTVIDIATPRSDLLCWTPGDDRQSIAQQAREYNLTFIPVVTGGKITGLVTHASLESDPEPDVKPLTADWLVAADTPILKIIELFAEQPDRIFLVLGASDIVGLVAPADLNRIPARASIYLLIASVEGSLGQLIRKVLPDEEACSQYLSEARLSKLREQQQNAASENLDLGLFDTLYFTDLIDIARRDEQLQNLLGFTATKGKKFLKIRGVRDKVSHPIRPLISSRKELRDLYEICQLLFDLNGRVAEGHRQLDGRRLRE